VPFHRTFRTIEAFSLKKEKNSGTFSGTVYDSTGPRLNYFLNLNFKLRLALENKTMS
jgi:hypothetical protein